MGFFMGSWVVCVQESEALCGDLGTCSALKAAARDPFRHMAPYGGFQGRSEFQMVGVRLSTILEGISNDGFPEDTWYMDLGGPLAMLWMA